MTAKDGFHEYVIQGEMGAVNPAQEGTKTAAHYRMVLRPGESAIVRLRLTDRELRESPFGKRFDAQIAQRVQEAEEFYATVIPEKLSGDEEDGPLRRRDGLGLDRAPHVERRDEGIFQSDREHRS